MLFPHLKGQKKMNLIFNYCMQKGIQTKENLEPGKEIDNYILTKQKNRYLNQAENIIIDRLDDKIKQLIDDIIK